MADLVIRNYKNGNLFFTMDIKGVIEKSKICFTDVGTPMDKDGSTDLQYVLAVVENIDKHIVQDMIIVNKSTVPVGTGDNIRHVLFTEMEKRGVVYKVSIVLNPEFLKEGSAVEEHKLLCWR